MGREDLSRATEAFSCRNLIGSGGLGNVYRGVLPGGKIVAIKVLTPNQQEADGSFQRECQTLLKVEHPNLLKMISSCSEADFKALVLEFMPNGSLDKHLHRVSVDGEVEELSLRKRWEILYQVASAISYLHHDCCPAIVHCDLKPQNVLLDETMTARVADFGIAQLMNIDTLTITSTLRGSIGYIAPEYAFGGRISTKGDVYSYGVLVLETLTQKSPTDPMFASGLTLSTWVSGSFPHCLRDVVEEIGPNSEYSMVERLAQVGLCCTSQLPHHRPSMTEVLNMFKTVTQTC